MNRGESVNSSGDVVIIVPSMDNLPDPVMRPDSHSHQICIEADEVVEPNSPKTITESSSEFGKYN